MTKDTEKSPAKSKSAANNSGSKSGSSAKKDIKKSSNNGINNQSSDQTAVKYNKLKKKHRYLREEYSKVLESWEMATKQLKVLLEERK